MSLKAGGISMTKFGKRSPVWHNWKSHWQFLSVYAKFAKILSLLLPKIMLLGNCFVPWPCVELMIPSSDSHNDFFKQFQLEYVSCWTNIYLPVPQGRQLWDSNWNLPSKSLPWWQLKNFTTAIFCIRRVRTKALFTYYSLDRWLTTWSLVLTCWQNLSERSCLGSCGQNSIKCCCTFQYISGHVGRYLSSKNFLWSWLKIDKTAHEAVVNKTYRFMC